MKDEKLHIHTIQSYLVMETEKFYQKIVADFGISHFYSFKSDSEKNFHFLKTAAQTYCLSIPPTI